MGKFDGILIMSDWDGTLCYGSEIPEANIEKIKYFCDEGGLFTVCTGRFYSHIEAFADKIKPNTLVGCLNGTYVIDPVSKKVVSEGFAGDGIHAALYDIAKSFPCLDGYNIYPRGCTESVRLSPEEYLKIKDTLDGVEIYKAMLVSNDEGGTVAARDFVNAKGYAGVKAMRSWSTGLELMSPECHKGTAARLIKKITGAKTLVCVGDYENDADMLLAADISYAPENATDMIKSIATKITRDVWSGTLAAVIDDIEKICKIHCAKAQYKRERTIYSRKGAP